MICGRGLDSGDTTTRFGAPNANGANDDPATDTFAIAIGTMLTRRSSSAFDLFDHLVQQLQTAKRVPTAQVHETPEAYEVKATERTLLISAWRRSQRQPGGRWLRPRPPVLTAMLPFRPTRVVAAC